MRAECLASNECTYPRILGHELGVEALHVPANERGIQAGARCAVEPYLSCGRCHACKLGKTDCCERLQVLLITPETVLQP
jgi:alcohol dehydrogenase